MPTPINEPYKEDQREARRSQYRIYRRINRNKLVAAGHTRPVAMPFHISGLGFISAFDEGKVSPLIVAKKRLRRNSRNRMARLSRRANRRG